MDLIERDPAPRTAGAVVCTHLLERLEQMSAAVDSLQRQTRPLDELVVVVDGTAELARAVAEQLPGVQVECTGENRGVSVARTLGAEKLGTDVVLFLDDDAVAADTWVAEMLAPLAGDGAVIGTSGRSEPDWLSPPPAWLPEEFFWTIGCSFRGMPTEVAPVRNVYGGCAAIRRRQFLELGGYTVALGHLADMVGGAEEAEFGLRATLSDPRVRFLHAPAAVIHHKVPGNRLTWRYFWRRCYEEGLLKAEMSRLMRRQTEGGALAAERDFALTLPLAALRYLAQRGRRSAAVGIVVGALGVVAGLVRGQRLR